MGARIALGLTALLAIVVLVGWAFDLPTLRSAIPGAVEMKANTAIALLAVSLALVPVTRSTDTTALGYTLLPLFVTALGAATLWEYAYRVDLGIDELVVRDTGAAFNALKGRMSPYSAVAFVVLGIASFGLCRGRWDTLVRMLAGVAGAIGAVSIVGYLWNASEIVTDRVAPPVAVNTACAFVLLALAIFLLAARAHHGAARSRLETIVLGGFVPTFVLLVIGGGLTYESGTGFSQATERVAHTHEVRIALAQMHGAIADAESARRNHILTNDESFEKDFGDLAKSARKQISLLGWLVADNPSQAALQQQLQGLIEARIAALEETGKRFRESGEPAAREALTVAAREGVMQRIRDLSVRMNDAEEALLRTRLARVHDERRSSLTWLLITLGAASAIFVLLFRSIRHEVQARNQAEEKLHELNTRLEERVEARTRELSFQQAFMRRVIDLNRNLIFAKDRDGRFVLANQAFADAYGTTVEGLVGQPEQKFARDAAQLQEFDEFRAADLQVIESGQDLVIDEEPLTTALGESRWLTTVKRPILSPDGTSTIVLGVSTDITERKRAQDEVRQLADDLEIRVEERTRDLHESNRKLEEARLASVAASRAKSAFLANMSHEIRTPMNAIIGLTHLMSREARDTLQHDRLTKVGDAAKHLLQVINDILDMSKIEAGKLSLNKIEFATDELLTTTTSMISGRARDKGLELILDTDHLPARLIGDATRLSQILINLLTNAAKFTERGWIRLRCSIEAQDADRLFVRFEVQDTGPGIPPDKQPALFNAFEQIDNSISRQHGGTGLGLALSRQLARAMGGDTGVTSAPGAGSTFWFTAWLGRGSEAVKQALDVPAMKGLRALLVDDLPEALSVIGERLKIIGLEVDAQASGPAAVAQVEHSMATGRPYDVFVIDWRMEPLDGIQTLGRLRRLLGDGTPPSILVTAFDDPVVAQQALTVNFDAVLLKPITTSALHDTLARLLQKAGSAIPIGGDQLTTLETQLRERHAGQRVLLGEDNPVNREVAEQLLQSAGLIVETANDGARAVEQATTRRYDLILMDMQMPVMDGLEATRLLRSRLGRGLPIIAMTANAFVEDREACLAAGMNDHVAKPVDPAVMYATMLKWLPLRQAKQPDTSLGADGALDPSNWARVRGELDKIEDLDTETALRNVARQMSVLVRVLHRFSATYRQGLPDLLIEGGDEHVVRLKWRTTCHSMRGAFSAIAAVGLLEELNLLEQALDDGASMEVLRSSGRLLHESLLAFIARLDSALQGA